MTHARARARGEFQIETNSTAMGTVSVTPLPYVKTDQLGDH